ncbi:glycosyltransferase family 4 protein [Limosilactobacillus vaginalis]|uniref:glycosyltransferase family 4 protein n=1 Tax=Limosilactobacillus vaginalis TaxID=1633 RepID=UPI00360C501D
MKNVLFIRANAVNPDSRVEKEVNSLIKNGYNVSILAWDREADYPLTKGEKDLPNGKAIIYRVGIKAGFGNGMKNFPKLLKFQSYIHSFLKRKSNYDVVHACDFDTAFTAFHSLNRKKTKFVYDIFDYYIDAFAVPKSLKKIIWTLDKKIINNADATIICTEQREKQLKGTEPKKLVVIHNTPPLYKDNESNYPWNRKITRIAYLGMLSHGRLIDELIDIVKKDESLELHIGGFGIIKDKVERASKEASNIKYYGTVPYHRVLSIESKCDIMLAIYDPSIPNHHFAAPNKFYEALMLGKPLIMVRNTGISYLVEKDHLGTLIDYSEDGLKNGIHRLIKYKAQWRKTSIHMKEMYRNKFSWEIMEKRLVSLYEELLK